jgi:hypothetical protein
MKDQWQVTLGTGMQMPRVISDAGHWNNFDFGCGDRI